MCSTSTVFEIIINWDLANENVVSPHYVQIGLFRKFYHKHMTYLVSLKRLKSNLTDSKKILTIQFDSSPRWLLKNGKIVDFHSSVI